MSEADSQSRTPVLGRRIRGLPRRHRLVRRRVLRTNDRRLGLRLRGGASHTRHRDRHGLRRAKRQAAGTPGPRADRHHDRTPPCYVVSSTLATFLVDPLSISRRRQDAPRSLVPELAYHLLPYLATPRRALKRILVEERCDALLNQSYEDARFDIAVWWEDRLESLSSSPHRAGSYIGAAWNGFSGHAHSRCAGVIIASRFEAQRVMQTYGSRSRRLPAS